MYIVALVHSVNRGSVFDQILVNCESKAFTLNSGKYIKIVMEYIRKGGRVWLT